MKQTPLRLKMINLRGFFVFYVKFDTFNFTEIKMLISENIKYRPQ